MKYHDRPWKCVVQSCEHAEKGFLSRSLRDEHLDHSHQQTKSQPGSLPNNPDLDEIQPIFFDLIRLDKVEEVKSIANQFSRLSDLVQKELFLLIASSGSASMAQVLYKPNIISAETFWSESIKSTNFETLRWFLSKIDRWKITTVRSVLEAVLTSGSLEIFQECKKHIINMSLCSWETRVRKEGDKRLFSYDSVAEGVIRATAGNLDREHLLLLIWASLVENGARKFCSETNLGRGLCNVAKTSCSLVLTKALFEYGVQTDFMTNSHSPTPLHLAARQNSLQAAELMKFLLYHGADPLRKPGVKTLPRTQRSVSISEERGAQNIAKWVGMSWDELVDNIKLDIARGFCPPEYR